MERRRDSWPLSRQRTTDGLADANRHPSNWLGRPSGSGSARYIRERPHHAAADADRRLSSGIVRRHRRGGGSGALPRTVGEELLPESGPDSRASTTLGCGCGRARSMCRGSRAARLGRGPRPAMRPTAEAAARGPRASSESRPPCVGASRRPAALATGPGGCPGPPSRTPCRPVRQLCTRLQRRPHVLARGTLPGRAGSMPGVPAPLPDTLSSLIPTPIFALGPWPPGLAGALTGADQRPAPPPAPPRGALVFGAPRPAPFLRGARFWRPAPRAPRRPCQP